MMEQLVITILALLAIGYCIRYLICMRCVGELASPHAIYALLGLVHFILPGLLIGLGVAPNFINPQQTEFVLHALMFAFVSMIAVQIGSSRAAPFLLGISKSHGPIRIKWSDEKILIILAILSAIGWASRGYVILNDAYIQYVRSSSEGIEGNFSTAIRMFEIFPYYVLSIIGIRYWRPDQRDDRLWRILLIASLVLEIGYWLPAGRKEPIILAALTPIAIRYIRTGELPSYKATVTMISAVGLLFPLAFFYRYAIEMGGAKGGAEDLIGALGNLQEGEETSGLTSYEILFGRLSYLEPVAGCIRLINDQIWEPMYGNSYLLALTGLIPRFIWHNKPELHYGNDFGYVAGYLPETDLLTSISVTFFGEAYLNFASLGVIPMMMMGAIFGVLFQLAQNSTRRETWLLLYMVALPTVLYTGGTFALYFGGLVKLLPFFLLIGWLMDSDAISDESLVRTHSH